MNDSPSIGRTDRRIIRLEWEDRRCALKNDEQK